MGAISMKILASGINGFVGGYLKKVFEEERGWQVQAITRTDFALEDNQFRGKLEGADVIIHLAGATISKRWTEEYKKLMYSSRIDTTKKIVRAIAGMNNKPQLFISTSAVGRFSPEGINTEESRTFAGDFLGILAADWEAEALKASDAGVRTVIFRFGVVLGPNGGMMAKVLLPFKLGLGGTIGDGSQSVSWIHLRDLANAELKAIDDKRLSGIYNLCSPDPTTNKGLTKALGRALHRPTIFRIPVFMLRLIFSEGADTFASGQKVIPKRLLDAGFRFKFADIDAAVSDIVKETHR
jgi:uncharacterized protein (TIGR01777 family)